ncbi:zinc-binding loop region of homing endonuclease-domain-containing protein [Lipomyces chichibuensis]|uniref:zinc-binding loop region of homing endonuclease-domain-containing protein n=1 Tax=Lipomyces chichibuensis TaxID=1546026 RepID=UPI0033434AC0
MQGYEGRNGSYPPAIITPDGCHLPQKQPDGNGYISIYPIEAFTGNARKDQPEKLAQVGAHRVVCYVTKCNEDVHNLVYRGYHASHLCHRPGCINKDHLVVETAWNNYRRRECAVKVNVKTNVNGRDYFAKAEECPHSPPCIIKLELRAARIIDSR